MKAELLTLYANLDTTKEETLAVQIYRNLLSAIRDGRIRTGERLPSSRSASRVLGVSRNTVNTAYDLLKNEVVIDVRRGAAPVVIYERHDEPVGKPSADTRLQQLAMAGNVARSLSSEFHHRHPIGRLRPDSPDETLFPREIWGRLIRRAALKLHGEEGKYAHPWGIERLQQALCERLRADRGVLADPEQILITPGAQASLTLIAQALGGPGSSAAFEDPGPKALRTSLTCAGVTASSMPVDAHGARFRDVDNLADQSFVFVTPSNQFPTGARMSLARREEIMRLVSATGALIVEDDYDSEFLWRGREIPALHALSNGQNVIYLGTASKSLLPGLRLGWMVVPTGLVETFRNLQQAMGMVPNVHAQSAFAEFLESGFFCAHIRNISSTYKERGLLLRTALMRDLGDRCSVPVPNGGLHLLVRFKEEVDDRWLAKQLHAFDFAPAPLSDFCDKVSDSGLIVGYGTLDERLAARFTKRLAQIIDASSPTTRSQ